eukprot:1416670-Amphidinium_carterae.1
MRTKKPRIRSRSSGRDQKGAGRVEEATFLEVSLISIKKALTVLASWPKRVQEEENGKSSSLLVSETL